MLHYKNAAIEQKTKSFFFLFFFVFEEISWNFDFFQHFEWSLTFSLQFILLVGHQIFCSVCRIFFYSCSSWICRLVFQKTLFFYFRVKWHGCVCTMQRCYVVRVWFCCRFPISHDIFFSPLLLLLFRVPLKFYCMSVEIEKDEGNI